MAARAKDSNRTVGALVGLLLAFASAAIPVAADQPTEQREATTPAMAAAPADDLIPLEIAPPDNAPYDREAQFGRFIDADKNCRDTRAELLVVLSQRPLTFTTARECRVKTGRWTDPWSGTTSTVANDFDIDHTVPLKNAWRSGASDWSQAERVTYANNVDDVDHLVPITKSSNRSKQDKGPEAWQPSNPEARCRYAHAWNRIKAKWDLTATHDEWNALVDMAETC